MKLPSATAFCLLLLAAPGAADTILVNATVHTVDREHPQATALAWNDSGWLLAVGASEDLVARFPQATRIDAGGGTVIPGLIDAHGHVLGLGQALAQADLVGTRSAAEVIARLQAWAAEEGGTGWLLGRGWDQNAWPRTDFPTAADLDAAFPDRPVYLERVDGHAAWVNSAAMRLATRSLDGDWQPEGGHIRRVGERATGILLDNAEDLVADAIPALDAGQTRRAYARALAKAVSVGLTGVGDAAVDLDDFRVLQAMAAAGEIPLRLYEFATPGRTLDWLCSVGGQWQEPTDRLRMRTLKLVADGALGSRGAALLADYSDDPGNRGFFVTPPETYTALVRQAHGCGVQVATHAIGDRGNRMVLDTYAEVLGADATTTDHRWRIEHAQVLASEDIPRLARLHLIASMQPTHATSDMPWAQRRVGPERIRGAYAWQRLREAGVPLAFGSDFPVEDVNPMLGLYAAVSRQDLAGKPRGGWFPDQRMSRTEALAGFTRDAARAQFMEGETGILKPGLQADFVLFDADFMTVPERQIADLRVLGTWVGGERVYTAED